MSGALESFKKGMFALEKKQFADASGFFEKAVELNSKNIDHYYYLAYAYAKQGKFPVAMKIIRQALKLPQSTLKTYNVQEPYAPFFVLIGAIHEQQGVHDKAVRAYQKAISLGTPKQDALEQRIAKLKP